MLPIESRVVITRKKNMLPSIIRKEPYSARVAIEYRPTGRKPISRPKIRLMDGERQELERLGATE